MVLVGNYGHGNAGDEVILAYILEIVGDLCEVVVPSRDPDEVRRLHGQQVARTVKIPSLAAVLELLVADLLVIGGGGIFGRGIQPLPSALPAVAIGCKLLGKKVGYLAIGAYPGTPLPVRWLLRLSAVLSDVVAVRDAVSLRTMNARVFGRSSRPFLVRDPGVDLTPADRATVVRILGEAGVSDLPAPLFVAIKATPSAGLTERMLSAVARALDWWCENREGQVALFAFSGSTDYGMGDELSDAALAGRVAAMTRYPERVRVVEPGLHPRVLKGAVALSAGVVGVPLHAQIFAWSTGRPLLGLSFEEKSDAFLAEVGADMVPLAVVDARKIVAWMEGL